MAENTRVWFSPCFIIYMVSNSHSLLFRMFCRQVLDLKLRGYGRKEGFVWGFFWSQDISWQWKSSTASKTAAEVASNSSRNWIPVIKMHHVHVYRHEISPWKAGGSTLQLEAIYQLCYAEASKIAAFLKLHMQQSCHNSGSYIPAANVLSCHPFDIYLTSKVCVSSVTLLCKPDKTWSCILYKIKASLTHNLH